MAVIVMRPGRLAPGLQTRWIAPGDLCRRRRRPLARRRRAGSTLLELLLVMAIVAVIAAIALPRYIRSEGRYRAEMAARRTATDLEWVCRRARAASADRTITFDPAGEAYVAVDLGTPQDPAADYRLDLAQAYDVDLVSASFAGGPAVTFDGYGRPTAGGTVVLRAGTYQRTVVLAAQGGRVSIE